MSTPLITLVKIVLRESCIYAIIREELSTLKCAKNYKIISLTEKVATVQISKQFQLELVIWLMGGP